MTRSRTRVLSLLLLSWLPALLATVPGAAQELALAAAQAPRFLMPGPSPDAQPVEVDVSTVASLRRRVTLDLERVRLGDALEQVSRQAGVKLVYVRSVVPLDSLVRIKSDGITVAAALTDLLMGLKVDVLVSARGQLAIVPSAVARAAPGTIAGRVVNKQDQSGIAAAEVLLGGTELRTTTAEDGTFQLGEVPPGDYVLFVRRIGYAPHQQKLTVGDGATVEVRIQLAQSATRLDELVTTVTGDQRRLELGNTIATINADSLMQIAPVLSLNDLLQGRAPGVFSLPEGSTTGRAGRIRIRGLNSTLVANDPIVVIDGVRVEAGAGQSGVGPPTGPTFFGGLTGRLVDLDPGEIASVEIVKGPSAATLYGTDAANGVIVITTKRGQPGQTRWTAFTEQGLLEQRLDQADLYPDAYYAFGRSTATNAPQRCTLLQRAAGSCVVDSLGSFNTHTNPDTRPFKDSRRQQYGLQASGGTTGGTTYFLGGDYELETGTAHMPELDQALIRAAQGREVPDWQVRPNAYERLNLRANLTAPLGRRGAVTLATGFLANQARHPSSIPEQQVGYRDVNDGWATSSGFLNRPAYVFATRQEDVVRRFTGSVATTYTVWDWLTLRGTVGTDLSTNATGTLLRRNEAAPGSPANEGSRSVSDLALTRYSLDFGATASHALSVAVSSKTSVGVQYNRRTQRGTFTRAFNLPLGGETIAGGTIQGSPFEATLATAVAGGYVEQVFGLRERLFLTGALRLDGGSAFGQDFSVAAYPKASLSWVVTDAQAGPRLPGVSSLRFRTAYGASGVQPGPTDALAMVAVANGLTVDGTAAGPVGFLVGGNPDLKPERASEVEAGLDLELWQSRVRLEFTAYQRTSTDALIERPNAPSVGGSRIENLGSVRNRGLELLLSADLLRGHTVAAGFTATGALNQNRLRQLGDGVVPRSPTGVLGQHELGYPLFGLWGFGIESFADANGNGIIEPTEIVVTTETQFIGPNFPTREATVAPYLRLFGDRLHLSGLFQYRGDFYRSHAPLCAGTVAICQAVNDASTPLAEQARVVTTADLRRTGPHIADASHLLLRELSLGLTVPASVARVLGARTGQLVLAGRNLALLWKASTVPIEAGTNSVDGVSQAGGSRAGPSSYWLLRVHLNY